MSRTVVRIPGWVRAVFVCGAIPALWAVEVWMGLLMVRLSELVFADVGKVPELFGFIPASPISFAIACIGIWIIYRTPFAVLSFAFLPDSRPRTDHEEYSSE